MEGTDDCPFEGESEQRAAPQQSQHGGRAKLGQLGKATSVQVEATAPAAAPSLRFMPRGRSVDVAPVPEEAEAPMFGKRKEFIRLKNLLTGQDTVDTLHQSGIMVCPVACTPQRCVGSMMTPSGGEQAPKRPHGVVRPRDEVEEHARDFLNQYYASLKRHASTKDTAAHEKRLTQVLLEIEERGTYNLTEKELAYGAKMAWRNAPRCIGRIQWNRLQLFDCRHVTTASEMLDAIKRHIEYGTNAGNIRSAITVFPQRLDGQSDFRVWSPQFFKYAAFKQEDGSILGDPSSIEFTEVCKNLGWKPEKEGPFVCLPLVVQARGQPPEFFDISDLNWEVDLTHPVYEWFAELGLKWYCVPAVTNLLFDCGGIEFPAAPFNGWYMGTEIGRDLCDESRYNILPEVARRMGLDTRTASSLWKDKALVEVNLAILHSFQKKNVTISDHHSASESFMKHMEKEFATRGGCPTDWVWVNPPMSASTTPVYHQEMLMYQLRPSYEYQEDPWRIEAHRKLGDRKDRFRHFARVVQAFNRMFKTSMSRRVKAIILYATETGRSATYAKKVGELFSNSFNFQVMCMDEYNPMELEHEQLVIIVSSTFGNGEPPENGTEFFQTLTEMAQEDESSQWLTNIKFSVFGLGSRAYPHFCAFGKELDKVLNQLGGERLLEAGEGDELCGQEESFQDWLKRCYLRACQAYHIADADKTFADKALSALPPAWEAKMFRIKEDKEAPADKPLTEGLGKLHHKKTASATVKSIKELQSAGATRSTILVEFETYNNALLAYNPGDHLGVCPANDTDLVEAVLSKLSLDHDADSPLLIEVQQRGEDGNYNNKWVASDRFPEKVSMRKALSHYLDVTSPPTPQFITLVLPLLDDKVDGAAEQKERLEELAKGLDKYEDWKYDRFSTLAEFLNDFPALKVTASLILSQLPLLQPRFYSISSCPKLNPGEVHLTVAVVTYETKAGTTHHGVCSTWLSKLSKEQQITCFVRKAPSFHLPQDFQVPVIMVGPGTGIAPFRSFWQHRRHLCNVQQSIGDETRRSPDESPFGKMKLFFGCRHDKIDNIYKQEINENLLSGSLSRVCYAFSRDPNHPKKYVQERIEDSKEAEQLIADICDSNGHIYVCGDVSMADRVCRAFENILMTMMSTEEAREYITLMKSQGRYHEDIFGVTLKTQEVTDGKRAHAKKLWAMSAKRRSSVLRTEEKIRPAPTFDLRQRRTMQQHGASAMSAPRRTMQSAAGQQGRRLPGLAPPKRISSDSTPRSPKNSLTEQDEEK